MSRLAPAWLAVSTLGASPALAGQLAADFTSSAQLDTAASSAAGSPALWDTVNHQLSAPWTVGSGTAIDFGDGSDGAFSDGPAQTGVTVSGSTITINTDTKAEFKFSSFKLSHGITLTATGSKPLVIRVLGPTTVAGAIDVSGKKGTDNSAAGTSPGGPGGPGGSTGGNAGTPASGNGTGGAPTTGTNPLGGGGGNNSAVNLTDNGGGGGCNGKDGTNDATAGGTGGTAGACTITRAVLAAGFDAASNPTFTAGAGGGGGGDNTFSGTATGSGGGGGGGAIHLTSLGAISFGTTPNLGAIVAKGGNTGNNTTTAVGGDAGGCGGGGSGGAIWLQSAGALGDTSNVGTTDVSGGSGTDSPPNGTAGGNGSIGILRVDTSADHMTHTPVAAAAATNIPAVATNKTYVLVSHPFDLLSSAVTYSTPTETFGCGNGTAGAGSIQVAYEGSNDGSNYSGDVAGSQISTLNGYRYLRFKTTITTGTATTAPCLTALTIPYASTAFEVKGGLACGTTRRRPSAREALGDTLLLALAALVSLKGLSTRRRKPARCSPRSGRYPAGPRTQSPSS